VKPRKNPLVVYTKTEPRDITFHGKDIEAETSGIIDTRGFFYIGVNFAGQKATCLVHREKQGKE